MRFEGMKIRSGFKYLAAAVITAALMIHSPAAAFAEEEGNQEAVSEDTAVVEQDTAAAEPETDPPAPETQAPETQAPETQAPETQAPETQAPETETPETQAAETYMSETEMQGSGAGETQADESQATETFLGETAEMTESIIFEEPESESEIVFESETESESLLFTDTEVETAWSDILSDEDYAAVVDLLRSDTGIPIEGLPAYLTQEMVSGALKIQEEKGFPASVVLATIIVESGNGTYGASEGESDGLTKLAFEYHNLFALKGTGTAGTMQISPEELKYSAPLASDDYYYRVYNTDMESIDDWADYIDEYFGSTLRKTRGSDEFSMALAACRTTEKSYYLDLRKAVKDYGLERLDTLTLEQFESMLSTYVNPCPGSHVTSGFGYRSFDHKVHLGIDLATGSRKVPTYAADSGRVVSAAFGSSVGNMIVIDHGNGIVTKYMHHSKMYVKAGDYVVKGQQIGLAGTTGHSTGIHLHYQVEVNGSPVNPLPYLVDDMADPIPMDNGTGSIVEVPSFDLEMGNIRIGDPMAADDSNKRESGVS